MIVDASVILSALFPDENQPQAQALLRDHIAGHARLAAPDLLMYEVTNAVLLAARRGRISSGDADAILSAFDGLGIETFPVAWRDIMPLALRCDRSAYDAAYLALAQSRGEPLITNDLRLYNAVRGELPWMRRLGENWP
jgi:predicted nucleic acid-binding protein